MLHQAMQFSCGLDDPLFSWSGAILKWSKLYLLVIFAKQVRWKKSLLCGLCFLFQQRSGIEEKSGGLMKDLTSSWDLFPPGLNTAFAVLGKVGVDEGREADYATKK